MKNFLRLSRLLTLSLAVGFGAVACGVEHDYDLDDVGGDFAIGGDQAQWRVELGSISGLTLEEIVDVADILVDMGFTDVDQLNGQLIENLIPERFRTTDIPVNLAGMADVAEMLADDVADGELLLSCDVVSSMPMGLTLEFDFVDDGGGILETFASDAQGQPITIEAAEPGQTVEDNFLLDIGDAISNFPQTRVVRIRVVDVSESLIFESGDSIGFSFAAIKKGAIIL